MDERGFHVDAELAGRPDELASGKTNPRQKSRLRQGRQGGERQGVASAAHPDAQPGITPPRLANETGTFAEGFRVAGNSGQRFRPAPDPLW